MRRTPSEPEPTGPAAGAGETDDEAALEITALPHARHATRLLLTQRVGVARLRRGLVSAVLGGLALVLVVLTPLPQAVWAVWALVAPPPPPSSTVTAASSAVSTPLGSGSVSVSVNVSATKATAVVQSVDWRALQARPLHFPTVAPGGPCPISPAHYFYTDLGLGLGGGPVYPYGFTVDGQLGISVPPRQTASGLVPGVSHVLWAIDPAYRGGALVRGAQLDGQHPVAFNGGYAQISYQGDWSNAPLLHELQLVSFPDTQVEWIVYGSVARLEAPGCYAFQVDGSTFSYILVFRAGI